MPTRRMIDPAIWQSESMAELTRDQRLLFIGLFSNADDQGRLRGNPNLIKSIIFPFDEDITVEQVKKDLQEISQQGCIIIYEIENKGFIQIAHWWDYQSPQWAYPSKFPAPPGWYDRLRYRKDNSVITYNWKPDHGGNDYYPPSEPINPNPPNSLGSNLPKTLPEDLGGSIELGLGLVIENKEEIEARAALAQISSFYQGEIGPLSSVISDKLLDLCGQYPAEWIKLAISGAAEHNVRKLSYIRGTLENWQAAGGPQNDKPKNQINGNGAKVNGRNQNKSPTPTISTDAAAKLARLSR